MTRRKTEAQAQVTTQAQANNGGCNCTALRKATRRISQLYDKALAPSGMKITQRAILARIHRSGSMSVGSLANALVMDSGALAHTLKPLERSGLVAVDVDPDDRRHRLVSLTAQGRDKLAETNALWAQAEKNFEAACGHAETESLRALLHILISDDFAVCFENNLPAAARQ